MYSLLSVIISLFVGKCPYPSQDCYWLVFDCWPESLSLFFSVIYRIGYILVMMTRIIMELK